MSDLSAVRPILQKTANASTPDKSETGTEIPKIARELTVSMIAAIARQVSIEGITYEMMIEMSQFATTLELAVFISKAAESPHFMVDKWARPGPKSKQTDN